MFPCARLGVIARVAVSDFSHFSGLEASRARTVLCPHEEDRRTGFPVMLYLAAHVPTIKIRYEDENRAPAHAIYI